MAAEWVDVFEGPSWKAELVKGELELAGIRAFVPDENSRVIYPFVTGGDVFSLRVQVPEESAIAAREILEAQRRAEREDIQARRHAELSVEGAGAAFARDPTRARAERLGWRVCWLSILPITAPIALVAAIRYFAAARSLSPKPRPHALAILATLVSFAWLPMLGFAIDRLRWPWPP